MLAEKYKIANLLEKLSIKIVKKKFLSATDGEALKAKEVSRLLQAAGVEATPQDLLDAWAEHEKEGHAASATTGALEKGSVIIPLRSPRFEGLCTLGEAHAGVFGAIRFARGGADGLVILISRGRGSEWAVVPVDTNAESLKRAITATCAKIPYGDGFLSTAMTEAFKATIIRASDALVAAGGKGADRIALKYLPHCLCASGALGLWAHEAGDGVTVVDGFSVGRMSVWDLLVQSLTYLSAVPGLIMELPRTVSNDPDVDCLHYIDLDAIRAHAGGAHPTWDKYLTRFPPGEADVLRAWIWSVFDAENRGRQMLYFYDPCGQSGKSAMLSAVCEVLGQDLMQAAQKDTLNNNFSIAKVWDKRLVTIGDNKNSLLVKSEAMHSLLGGDWMEVEYKHKNSFSARPNVRVFAAGNILPTVDNTQDNETSRILILRPHLTEEAMIAEGLVARDENGNILRLPSGNPQNLGDPNFKKGLIAEFRAFLADCEASYKILCPTRENIIPPRSVLRRMAMADDAENDVFDAWFRENLKRGKECYIESDKLLTALTESGYNQDRARKFISWMARAKRIEKARFRAPDTGERVRGFKGIALAAATDLF